MSFRVNYDSIAPAYDRRYVVNDYSGVERALTSYVAEFTGRVLEIGCGTGHWLQLLGEHANRVAGVDLSGRMLAVARTTARDAALALGRAEHLPWGDRTFGRLFCINALHHFEDKLGFLSEKHAGCSYRAAR
jgi:ubiquinone/menaquinone biosynthesis C-methylase UbiE